LIPTLTFDIETVPDVAGLRLLRDTPSQWSDAEVAEAAFAARREATGSDFLPLHLHRVVAISVALRERDSDSFRVWSLGEPGDAEGELIQRFFDGVERYTPQLVSWNGGGFDLPVLHYRGLVHGVRAARYWDLGEDDRDFRYSNYIGRYHTRHVDLMDLLAKYQPRASAPLDELARLVGLPGKIGMEGSRVWQAWQEERIEEIRAYCEADVANTHLLFQRFRLMRGHIDHEGWQRECALVRETLARLPGSQWREFLDQWPEP
jgi:predicted PolB exonuclease-like 3'-5' exonuclease